MKPVDLKAMRAEWDGLTESDPYPAHRIGDALFELAEALTGALLGVEWAKPGTEGGACPKCNLIRAGRHGGHDRAGCAIDAALTLAGFPDQETRDAERSRRAAR